MNSSRTNTVQVDLKERGYALTAGSDLELEPAVREYEKALADEWNNLEADNYLKDGARFRERRYGRFRYVPATDEVNLLAHRPYFQSEEANSYAGGIERVVEPLTRGSVDSPLLNELIRFNFRHFPVAADDERRAQPWEVACHQFRIISSAGQVGEPTPEGIHRDEIDFGAIHLMSKSNTEGGLSRVYDNDSKLIAEFCLEDPMDTMFWADQLVLHSVTPIYAVDDRHSAVRDILILGYTCKPGLSPTD